MGQVGKYLRSTSNSVDGSQHGYSHWCPACDELHYIQTVGHVTWTFNGNIEKPTFTPSLKHTMNNYDYCCHYVITDGKIYYDKDCSNEQYRNRVIDLPELPKEYKDNEYD